MYNNLSSFKTKPSSPKSLTLRSTVNRDLLESALRVISMSDCDELPVITNFF